MLTFQLAGVILTVPFMNEACGSHTNGLVGESTPPMCLAKVTVIVFVHFEHSGVAWNPVWEFPLILKLCLTSELLMYLIL